MKYYTCYKTLNLNVKLTMEQKISHRYKRAAKVIRIHARACHNPLKYTVCTWSNGTLTLCDWVLSIGWWHEAVRVIQISLPGETQTKLRWQVLQGLVYAKYIY